MNDVEKQLRKMPRHDRDRVMSAMEQIIQRDFSVLDRLKLKGYEHIYRVRIGNYRIVYFDNGKEIEFESLKRRNENTYNNF